MNLNADNIVPETMAELVRVGHAEKFLLHFPRWNPLYLKTKEIYNRYCAEISKSFEEVSKIEDPKEFADKVVGVPHSTILFELQKGIILSVEEFLRSTRNKQTIKSFNTFVLNNL